MNRAQQQDIFSRAFLANDFFREAVTYTASGAAARSIHAVVHRKGRISSGRRNDTIAGSQQQQYDVEIDVSTDAVDGVSVVTPKLDIVSLPLDIGDVATTFRVSAVLHQDDGAWRLGLLK